MRSVIGIDHDLGSWSRRSSNENSKISWVDLGFESKVWRSRWFGDDLDGNIRMINNMILYLDELVYYIEVTKIVGPLLLNKKKVTKIIWNAI